MTATRGIGQPLRLQIATAILGVAALVAGCGASTPPQVATPSPTAPLSSPTAEPSLTPVPGAPSRPSSSGPAASAATTEVEGFGRIFDTLPASFPKLPDESPVDLPDPASAAFVSNLSAATASEQIARSLHDAGWTVDVGSPLEDGTIVLEATGPTSGCKAEVRFTPQSGSITVSVLYGASCPFS